MWKHTLVQGMTACVRDVDHARVHYHKGALRSETFLHLQLLRGAALCRRRFGYRWLSLSSNPMQSWRFAESRRASTNDS